MNVQGATAVTGDSAIDPYRAVFDAHPEPMWVCDAVGGVLAVNEAALRTHGRTREEFLMSPAPDAGGETITRPIEWMGHAALLVVVTDRRTTELPARDEHDSAALFEALFEQSAVGIAIIDSATGRVLRASASYAEISGRDADELAATTIFGLTHDENLAALVDHLSALASGRERTLSLQSRRVRADGSVVPVLVTATPLREVHGTFLHHVEVLVDLTACRDAEEYLRAIVAADPECVKLLGADSELLDMNAAGLAMIEADSIEAVRGRLMSEVVVDADRPAFMVALAQVAAGAERDLEFQIQGFRGTRRWIKSRMVPFGAAGTRTAGVLAVARDVTAERRSDAELRMSRTRLETAVAVAPRT